MDSGSGGGTAGLRRRGAVTSNGTTPGAVAPATANARAPPATPASESHKARLEQQLHARRIHIDRIAAVVAFIQIATGTADAISREGCRPLLIGSLGLHAAHAWLLFGPAADWYSVHRTAVAAALLVTLRLVTALQIPSCNNPATGNSITLSFRLLYKTGFIPLLWYYAAIPLPFPLAATLHILSAILYNYTLIRHACTHVFVLPGDEALLQQLWQTATELVAVTSPLVGGMLAPTSQGPATHTCAWSSVPGTTHPARACMRAASNVCPALMTFLQAVLGVWVPLVIGYVLHRRGQQRLNSSDTAVGGGTAAAAPPPVPLRHQGVTQMGPSSSSGGGGGSRESVGGVSGAAVMPAGASSPAVAGAAVFAGEHGLGGGTSSEAASAGSYCVAPLAIAFATAAVSNVAYFAVFNSLLKT